MLVGEVEQGQGISRRLVRAGWSARVLAGGVHEAVERLQGRSDAPDGVLINEDALHEGFDFGRLRQHLRPDTPITLLVRPDFDLSALQAEIERWRAGIAILPLTPSELHALLRPVAPAPAPDRPGLLPLVMPNALPPSVLVVEDNLMNQIIAREMVAALGLSPAVVASGEEAMLSCRSTPPDLVLMDIQMPGMDGLETTRRLRALQAAGEMRRFPIIALTAHAMASDRQASLAAGMDEHLTKPVQLEQLRRVLAEWLAVGRQPSVEPQR